MITRPDLQSLEDEAVQMSEFTEKKVTDDPAMYEEDGRYAVAFMSRSGTMLADAKYLQDIALRNAYSKILEQYPKLTPSIINKMASAECERENYVVNLLDRINASCTHRIDWLRTLISKAKEEMRFANNQFNP